MAQGKFELFKGKNGEWYFRLKAANGQTILTSEGYKKRDSAENGIASVQSNAQAGRFEKRESKSGQFSFLVKATNGQVVGTSQMYKSESARDNGIASVTSNAPAAKVVEQLD